MLQQQSEVRPSSTAVVIADDDDNENDDGGGDVSSMGDGSDYQQDITFHPPTHHNDDADGDNVSSEQQQAAIPSYGSFVMKRPSRNSPSDTKLSLVLRESVIERRSPSSEHSVPYVGDVHELHDGGDDQHEGNTATSGSSFMFPTVALTKNSIHSISEAAEDIAFVPPPPSDIDVISDEEGGSPPPSSAYNYMVVSIPRDGSFVGDPKLLSMSLSSKSSHSQQPEEDISFIPLEEDDANNGDNGGVGERPALETDLGMISVPRDGSFVMDRKSSLIARTLSSDSSRDIDFSPAGSALETAAPPKRGSFFEERHASPKREHCHDIDVTPDIAGKNMPGSPPPKQGGFIGGEPIENTAVNINNVSKSQAAASQPVDREINFSPGGSEMETAPPPRRGSYHEVRHPTPVRESAHPEINVIPDIAGKFMPGSPPPKKGSFIGEYDSKGETTGASSVPPRESLMMPQAEDREINFSPGASDMETAAPPQRGSFSEDRHTSPMRGSSQHEINVVPDIAGKFMPGSSPPKQGSFVGENDMEGQSSQGGNEDTKNDEAEDSDDDDPMQDDQNLWRSKKLWEAARKKQNDKRDADKGGTAPCQPSEPQDTDEQVVIIPGEITEFKDSDQLTDSIHKLGALLGSAHNDRAIVPVNSKEEAEGLSSSIQRIGELLSSSHIDKFSEETKAMVEAIATSETGGNSLEEDPDTEEAIESADSDLLDDLLGDEELEVDEEDNSVSESIVELGPLPELSTRVENKGDEDDVTVHIANTTKQHQAKMTEESSDDFVPDDSIKKLEVLLDEALNAPLEEFKGKPNGSPSNFIEHGSASKKRDERNLPDEPSGLADLDEPESIEGLIRNDIKGSYIPNDSIAKLEALLDEALEAPLEPLERENQEDAPDDSASALDDFLDKALDDQLEITFEPTEEETNAMAIKVKTATPKPRSKPKPKPISSTSRLTRLTQSTKAKTKPTTQSTEPAPAPRKPAIPRFRGTKKTPRANKTEDIPEPPSKKPAVPRFRTAKYISKAEEGSSFMSGTFASRKKRTYTAGNKDKGEPRVGVARTKKIMSKLTSWTKRKSEKTKDASQDQSPAHAVTSAKSLPRESSTRSIDETIQRLAKPKPIMETPIKADDNFTGMPSITPHSGFYELSPMARSITSLSSQCSVTDFRSPRREGKVGCQKKFNPYLHDYRGPCELCVFFLSDEDKARLDAEGRHHRVMFTSGGCCNTCEIFPRSFDEDPARLCRMCYGNSHRKIREYFSSKKSSKLTLR